MANSEPTDDYSPYRPPPMVEEDDVQTLPPPAPGDEPKLNLAAVQIVFSLGASTFSTALMALTPASLLIAPYIFLLLFVLYWISEYSTPTAAGTRATPWKASTVFFLPFASMVIFVPIFIGGNVLFTDVFSPFYEESLLIFLPLCAAYYITLLVLTRYLQRL